MRSGATPSARRRAARACRPQSGSGCPRRPGSPRSGGRGRRGPPRSPPARSSPPARDRRRSGRRARSSRPPPRRRLRPVDPDVPERGDAVRLGERREQPLATKPFVDPDPAVEPLRAVVGEDEDDRVLVRVLEELPRAGRRRGGGSRGSRSRRGFRARACGARGPCTSRTRDACGRGPSRPSRTATTASSRAGARRARTAGRSSRTPAGGGTPCRPCGSPSCRRGTRRPPRRSRPSAPPGRCTSSRSTA